MPIVMGMCCGVLEMSDFIFVTEIKLKVILERGRIFNVR